MNTFDSAVVRKNSWRLVQEAGLQANAHLPLLESTPEPQPISSTADRMLCMNAIAYRAFGLPADVANAWLRQENLTEALSPTEREVLSNPENHPLAGRLDVHSLYALAWCTSVVNTFAVNEQMPRDFVNRLPDLRSMESSAPYRAAMILRPKAVMWAKLDEAYCFHWAWRDLNMSLKRTSGKNNLLMIQARRKALEWVFRGGDWDDVPLDT